MAKETAAKSGELVKPSSATTLGHREEVPEFLRNLEDNKAGLELLEQGDCVLPRLAIAQSLSPALKKTHAKFIQGLEEGMLYNTVTREIYGTEIYVIPVLFSKMRIYFEEMAKGGGILCQSINGIDGGKLCPAGCQQCEHSRFGTDGEAPECNNFMNYACILPNHGNQVLAVSMKSTALAVAKQWNSMMRLLNKPAFAKAYKITTVQERRGENEYFNYTISPGSYVSEEIFKFGTELHTQLKAQGIKVDLEDEELNDASFKTDEMGDAAQQM